MSWPERHQHGAALGVHHLVVHRLQPLQRLGRQLIFHHEGDGSDVHAVAGRPIERLRGLTGRLARENALRKPARTAVTAAALMVGLALVVFVTVFASGFKGSISKAVDRNFQGDLVIQNVDGMSPVPALAARTAAGVRGVQTVSSLSLAAGEIGGEDVRVSGVDPRKVNRVLSLDWEKGSPDTLSRLGPRDAHPIGDRGREHGLAHGSLAGARHMAARPGQRRHASGA